MSSDWQLLMQWTAPSTGIAMCQSVVTVEVRNWLKAAIKLVGDLRLLWGVKRTFRVDDGILYFVDERYTDIGIVWDPLTGTPHPQYTRTWKACFPGGIGPHYARALTWAGSGVVTHTHNPYGGHQTHINSLIIITRIYRSYTRGL